MKEKEFTFKNVHLILRPSSPVLKIIVIVLVVFSAAAFVALSWVKASIGSETEALRKEAALLEQDNRELTEMMEDPGSTKTVKEIARRELGLYDPNTVLVKPE